MRRRLVPAVLASLQLAVAAPAFAQTKPARLVDSAPAAVRPGMTRAQAAVAMERLRSGASAGDTSLAGHPAFERYDLGDGLAPVVRYDSVRDPDGHIRENDPIASVTIADFDELRPQIPTDLYDAVRAVHLTPSLEDRNPVALIRAVNALRPLGKDRALAALSEYARLASARPDKPQSERAAWRYDLDPQRIFWLARLLFVRTDGRPDLPTPALGGPDIQVPEGNTDWPLFPLVLQDEVPFFLNTGYVLGGEPESPEQFINYCRNHCSIRPRPLAPTASPFLAADRLIASDRCRRLFDRRDDHRYVQLVRAQATRCTTASPFHPTGEDCNCMPRVYAEDLWRGYLSDPDLTGLRWDAAAQRFALPSP